jgi:hypothetical protein
VFGLVIMIHIVCICGISLEQLQDVISDADDQGRRQSAQRGKGGDTKQRRGRCWLIQSRGEQDAQRGKGGDWKHKRARC